MGYFSRLATEIVCAYDDGDSIEDIASKYNMPILEVAELVGAFEDGNYDCDPAEVV